MLIILRLIKSYSEIKYLIISCIFIAIMIIIDINVIMKNLRIQSKNYAKIKICVMEIFSSEILLKTFWVLNVDFSERKSIICNLGFCFFTAILKILINVFNDKLYFFSNVDCCSKNRKIIETTIKISIIFCMFDITIIGLVKDFKYLRYVFLNIAIMIYIYLNYEFVMWIKKTQKQSVKIHVLESQNRSLSIMYDNMRGFRHDFSNFVQALDGYAKTNDIEGVKSMCESLTKDYKRIKNMEIIETNVLNNSAVGCVLTNKYFTAIQENITVNMECLIDLSETKEYSYEFCRILAILLDNAIEAAKQSDEKIINIKIFKDFQVNRKLIVIENTYNQVDIDLDKIFEKGYSSKENSENKHGLGLWTVRKILNKSNNLSLFTTKDEMFRQQLEIYR